MTESSASQDPRPTRPDPGGVQEDKPPQVGGKQHVWFADMSTARQAWESVGGAVVSGALAGFLLGYTSWGYLAAVLVAVIGGLGAGAQHRTLQGALARGFVAGGVWAAAVVAVSEISGREPRWRFLTQPSPSSLYGIIPACLIGAVSWAIGRRRHRSS